jgi:hypothetical protein
MHSRRTRCTSNLVFALAMLTHGGCNNSESRDGVGGTAGTSGTHAGHEGADGSASGGTAGRDGAAGAAGTEHDGGNSGQGGSVAGSGGAACGAGPTCADEQPAATCCTYCDCMTRACPSTFATREACLNHCKSLRASQLCCQYAYCMATTEADDHCDHAAGECCACQN